MAASSENNRAKDAGQPRSAAQCWTAREHVAGASSSEAPTFGKISGSIERTTEALQSTVELLSSAQKHELARQFGYDSLESLIAASSVMTLSDGSAWCLTANPSGAWTIWNVCAIDMRMTQAAV